MLNVINPLEVASSLKKLTDRRKAWLLHRAENQRRRSTKTSASRRIRRDSRPNRFASVVEIWQGGDPEKVLCVREPLPAPEKLCFDANSEVTSDFFDRIRRSFLAPGRTNKVNFVTYPRPQGMGRIKGYLDFSRIQEISTSAAVVLTAEYSRLRAISGHVPPTVNLLDWNPNVVTTLYELGFFSLLGHLSDGSGLLVEDGPTLTMPIFRAQNADELRVLDENLQKLTQFLFEESETEELGLDSTVVQLLTTISEAITNVTQHAYPEKHVYDFEHTNSFWVSATADRVTSSLTVVVYDQGASIPVTYPRMTRSAKISRFFRRALVRGEQFDYRDDGTYIRAAMRYGGSRTDQEFRGKGFPQMFEILQSVGAGRMSVRSRGGWCTRSPNGRMKSGSLSSSVGGTLVEWQIEIRK